MLAWNLFGAMRVLTAVLCIALAVIVYRARPQARQNRILAALLSLEGAGFLMAGLLLHFTRPELAYASVAVYMTTYLPSIFVYLLFIGTLESPLARPLRVPWVVRALAVLALASPAYVILEMPRFAATLIPVWFAPWEVVFGPTYLATWYLWAAVCLVAFVVSYDAWRRAPKGSPTRTSRGAVALGFGARDALVVGIVLLGLARFRTSYLGDDRALDVIHLVAWPAGALLLVALLTYGILRAQLFDIDLKIKRNISRSTVAAAFVAVFFAVSEGAAAFFEGRTGSTLLGIGAAAVLVFALAPLQRMAEGVADAAMPRVQATPEYVVSRKHDVYRAALEGALVDGDVTEREREILRRLQLELGIANAEARAMEDALRQAAPTA